MKATNKINTNKNIFGLVVVMFLMLASFSVNAQEKNNNVLDTTVEISNENEVASSSTEFALWFVGNMKSTSETKNSTLSFSKKSMINSGINPNKVLIKKVIKTIVSQENSVV